MSFVCRTPPQASPQSLRKLCSLLHSLSASSVLFSTVSPQALFSSPQALSVGWHRPKPIHSLFGFCTSKLQFIWPSRTVGPLLPRRPCTETLSLPSTSLTFVLVWGLSCTKGPRIFTCMASKFLLL